MVPFSLGLGLWLGLAGVAMAASESSSQSRDLDRTPTWAVSGVCAVIIIISLVLEKVLHKVGTVNFSVTAIEQFTFFSFGPFLNVHW